MIRVLLQAAGTMGECFGAAELELDLPDGATLGDLLVRIEQDHGERLAGAVWNWKEHRFRGPIVIMSGSRVLRERTTRLRDRQKVTFTRAVVGG